MRREGERGSVSVWETRGAACPHAAIVPARVGTRATTRLLPLLALLLASCACAVPPDRVLFSDSFDAAATATPYWWYSPGGGWVQAQRATRVLRQPDEDVTRDHWNICYWSNYSVVTKCMGDEGEGPWGVGLTAYDDGQGHSYRLRLGEARLYVEKVSGAQVRVVADVEAKVARGKWTSLRLALGTRPESTILLGKVWGSEEEEPKDWLLRAEDTTAPYSGGTIGLWTGNCPGRYVYVSAKQYDPANDKHGDLVYYTDFSDVTQGRLPGFWGARGGLWTRDTQDKLPVLRQMLEMTGPLYDENAAITLRWTGYTVSVRAVAHPGQTKWGFGVVGYCSPDGSNYRLRSLDNRISLVKRGHDGRFDPPLANVPLPLQRGRWYNLKLAVDNLRDSVRLQGKIWEDETEEPAQWQVTGYDRAALLSSGAPGVWCFGSAVDFDDFQVKTSTLSALNETLR